MEKRVSLESRKNFKNFCNDYQSPLDENLEQTLIVKEVMAELCFKDRKHVSASIYDEISKRYQDQFGAGNEASLTARENLAMSLLEKGKLCESKEELRDVCEKLEEKETNNVDVLLDKCSFAKQLQREKYFDEALSLLTDVWLVNIELYGSDDEKSLDVRVKIGDVLLHQGKYEECLDLFYELHNSYVRKIGSMNQKTLKVRLMIGITYMKQKQYETSMHFYRDLHKCYSQLYGEKSSQTMIILVLIGRNLIKQGKVDEALETYRKVYNCYHNLHGHRHHDTVEIKHIIGHLFLQKGNVIEALVIFQDVFMAYLDMYGISNVNTLECKASIAASLLFLRKFEVSLKYFEEVYDHYEVIYGKFSAKTNLLKCLIDDLKLSVNDKSDRNNEAVKEFLNKYRKDTCDEMSEAVSIDESIYPEMFNINENKKIAKNNNSNVGVLSKIEVHSVAQGSSNDHLISNSIIDDTKEKKRYFKIQKDSENINDNKCVDSPKSKCRIENDKQKDYDVIQLFSDAQESCLLTSEYDQKLNNSNDESEFQSSSSCSDRTSGIYDSIYSKPFISSLTDSESKTNAINLDSFSDHSRSESDSSLADANITLSSDTLKDPNISTLSEDDIVTSKSSKNESKIFPHEIDRDDIYSSEGSDTSCIDDSNNKNNAHGSSSVKALVHKYERNSHNTLMDKIINHYNNGRRTKKDEEIEDTCEISKNKCNKPDKSDLKISKSFSKDRTKDKVFNTNIGDYNVDTDLQNGSPTVNGKQIRYEERYNKNGNEFLHNNLTTDDIVAAIRTHVYLAAPVIHINDVMMHDNDINNHIYNNEVGVVQNTKAQQDDDTSRRTTDLVEDDEYKEKYESYTEENIRNSSTETNNQSYKDLDLTLNRKMEPEDGNKNDTVEDDIENNLSSNENANKERNENSCFKVNENGYVSDEDINASERENATNEGNKVNDLFIDKYLNKSGKEKDSFSNDNKRSETSVDMSLSTNENINDLIDQDTLSTCGSLKDEDNNRDNESHNVVVDYSDANEDKFPANTMISGNSKGFVSTSNYNVDSISIDEIDIDYNDVDSNRNCENPANKLDKNRAAETNKNLSNDPNEDVNNLICTEEDISKKEKDNGKSDVTTSDNGDETHGKMATASPNNGEGNQSTGGEINAGFSGNLESPNIETDVTDPDGIPLWEDVPLDSDSGMKSRQREIEDNKIKKKRKKKRFKLFCF